ncbi:calmin isoform X1 [Mustela nigripes]|uniref:calmin isoform X1 n=1 Tax=Mustela nigripes TaxID=77151 RepID=UPI0028167F1A|nr:calmin isoform X1 [Mustela nigripes]
MLRSQEVAWTTWRRCPGSKRKGSRQLLPGRVERENVQKRTFTRWVNLHLEKCNPPLEVKDLFVDIQDGKILMALLEVLSGRNLLQEYKSSSHRIFRLNNIAKALKFLEDSNVKLVSIDAAEIADGNPSLVLGLIWNIILFFQIKELTGNLSRNSPSSSLSPGSGGTDSDSSFPPTPTAERSLAVAVKDQRKAIRTLLAWVQRKTRKYGVAVQDFAGSWRSGMAFLAVIKAIDPSLVDMKQALEDSMRENLEKAFSIAHEALHIPRLLEPEDIMVDTPDEQSIVTYVAQFLEHFPELEAEDFMDSDREAPIESTFVRIKETPSEQESTVLLLTENGDRAYTVNHEASQPPPSKVFVCDKPESEKECFLSGVSSHALSDSSPEFTPQIIDQALQGVPGKASSTNDPPPESSILSSRKDSRRSNSLPIKKTVHFEADTYKDASCSKDPFYSQDLRFEGSPRGTKDSLPKQDGYILAVETAEEKPKQEVPKGSEAASDESPGDISLVDGKINHSQTAQSSPSWNGEPEGAASPREESCPLSPFGDNTVMADSLEIKVKLLTVEAMSNEDYYEDVPLKASTFNNDLIDFASTSQAFKEVPWPHEKKPAEDEVLENQSEKLGKRRSKSAHQRKGSDESPERPSKLEPHKDPRQEDQSHSLAPGEAPADKKPEVYEKPKRKSTRRHLDEDEGEVVGLQGPEGEAPSEPPSSSVSLETLHSRSEVGLDFKPSPPLSKVSVIPHELFYYPHYEVPLAAVLEAYAEGAEDLKNEDLDLEEPDGYLCDVAARDEAEEAEEVEETEEAEEVEEAEVSQSSCSFSGLGEDVPEASFPAVPCPTGGVENTRLTSEPADLSPPDDHQQGEAEDSSHVENQQKSEHLNLQTLESILGGLDVQETKSQEFGNQGNLANSLEENVMGETISSKKKEKRKHVDHVESSIFIAPGSVRSSEDLEEDPGDHKVLSRTSHSDSSIYIRRHTNRSLESDHVSYVQLRNAADLDDRRNRTLTRRANNSGEATLLESQRPQSDSLTQFVQQPDMMYFILFLWLLVYCLLLFPQLDVNRL